ncbi:hypothetical protein JW826_01615 [Candidatus Woesearchaeota archaeon]|nr:hypothetical protein [Candidatus Woesearchaeota archaeon]
MHELSARIEKHYKFSKSELFQMSMTSLVAAFGLTISVGWGFFNLIEEQSLINYFVNFLIVAMMIFISILVHTTAQKIVALKLGYRSEYGYWLNGFLISTFVCFITFGFIPFFFTGSVWTEDVQKLRMGRFRYRVMQKDLGYISFAGPMASMAIAIILSFVYVVTENPLLFAIIVTNLLIALYSLIPIPRFEKVRQFEGGTTGLYLFIASRWVFVLVFFSVLIYSLLLFIAQLFSVILALFIGIAITVVYKRLYDD